ncbi:MAG: response regulator, partial [Archangium sp.]|nr:response regulator [Archangium sp.]
TARIVVIDDDAGVCDLLARVLTLAGHTVQCARTGETGLAWVKAGELDCLIVDKNLPDMHGGEVVAEARRRIPGLPIVMVTAYPEPFSLGAERPDVCLEKPFESLKAIEEAVLEALDVAKAPAASPLSGLFRNRRR